jgi:hypothetical protein
MWKISIQVHRSSLDRQCWRLASASVTASELNETVSARDIAMRSDMQGLIIFL